MVRGSGCLVGFFFFVLFYLTLKNEEVQNAIPIFSQGGGHKFTEFTRLCYNLQIFLLILLHGPTVLGDSPILVSAL